MKAATEIEGGENSGGLDLWGATSLPATRSAELQPVQAYPQQSHRRGAAHPIPSSASPDPLFFLVLPSLSELRPQRTAETTTTTSTSPALFLLCSSHPPLGSPCSYRRYRSFFHHPQPAKDGRLRGQSSRCHPRKRRRSRSLGTGVRSGCSSSSSSSWRTPRRILRSCRSERCERPSEPPSRKLRQGTSPPARPVHSRAFLTTVTVQTQPICANCATQVRSPFLPNLAVIA